MARQIRVAVLGAAGTIAPAIIHDLGASEEVDSLLALDLDGAKAAAVAERHGAGRASAEAADASDVDGLASRLEGADVLVNTASYRINLDAMSACLKAGCTYLDLGGLYWVTARQLARHDEFEQAGGLAILGLGSSPGKTNLMAAQAVAACGGDAIEEIEIFAGGRDLATPADGRLRPPYAIQTLIDELTMAPVVLREGAVQEIEPLTDGGPFDYGDPIGVGETIYTLHSELSTFGSSFGCRAASFRLSLAPAVLDALRALIGASAEKIAAATREAASPSAETISVHVVRVHTAGGRVLAARAITRPHFGLGGSVVSTASPAAAAVRLIARGEVTATGALPPERCIEPEAMFKELRARGCEFSLSG